MRLFYLFFTGLFLTISASSIATASTDLPERMQGLWAMPDCIAPEKTVLHSRTHVLYMIPNQAVMDIATRRSENADYTVVQNGGLVYPVQIHDDGIMTVGILPQNAVLDERLRWSQLSLENVREYLRCEIQPSLPHDMAAQAMAALDVLEHNCRFGNQENCIRSVMAHFDEDQSGTINKQEAINATLLAMYIAPYLNYQPIENQVTMARLNNAYPIAVDFVEHIFRVLDTDGSGTLNYTEFDYAQPILQREIQQSFPYNDFTTLMTLYPKLYQ